MTNNSSVTPKCHISEIFPLYHQPRIQQSTEPLTTVHGENNDKPSNFPCSADFADHERPTLGKLGFHAVFTTSCSRDGRQRF
ncbi:Uncharacterised protein [Vibrio cholerae]|nr:Uncharacterised protein [Vibrio cholerae]